MNPAIEGPCARCQAANLYSNRVCSSCGARLPWALDVPPSAPPLASPEPGASGPQQRTNNWPLVRGICCALSGFGYLLVVIVIIFLTILGKQISEDPNYVPPENIRIR